jgi:hypothetical protein
MNEGPRTDGCVDRTTKARSEGGRCGSLGMRMIRVKCWTVYTVLRAGRETNNNDKDMSETTLMTQREKDVLAISVA